MYGNGWPLSTASGVSTGKTRLVERSLERALRLVVELGDAHQADAFAFERRQQLVVEQPHLLRQRRAQALGDRREVLGRRPAVLRTAHDLRLDLLLDRGDANHEELVEIRSVDRDELQPLEQRIARVERLLEDAIVELEPRQLAADIERGIVERRQREPLPALGCGWVIIEFLCLAVRAGFRLPSGKKLVRMPDFTAHVAAAPRPRPLGARARAARPGVPLGILAAESAALRGAVLGDGGDRPNASQPRGADAAAARGSASARRRRSLRSRCWRFRRSSSASTSAYAASRSPRSMRRRAWA